MLEDGGQGVLGEHHQPRVQEGRVQGPGPLGLAGVVRGLGVPGGAVALVEAAQHSVGGHGVTRGQAGDSLRADEDSVCGQEGEGGQGPLGQGEVEAGQAEEVGQVLGDVSVHTEDVIMLLTLTPELVTVSRHKHQPLLPGQLPGPQ